MVARKNSGFWFYFFLWRMTARRNKDEKGKQEADIMFESQALKLSHKINE
jgi:hypothetical protein